MLSHGVMNMFMNWLLGIFIGVSCICAFLTGQGAALAAAVPSGAQAGITLALSMAGSLCLWTGIGRLMEHIGITNLLSKFLSPLLHKIFPASKVDLTLAQSLSGNICANFLGLGNAATPMGIRSVQLMAESAPNSTATNEMCRFIVLNTASIQLIPATVAAVRASLGCATPYDILPAVWITSLFSAGLGMAAAYLLGGVFYHD